MQRFSIIPMVIRAQWHSCRITAQRSPGLLHPLLRRTMVMITKRLPIGLLPHEGIIALMRPDMVDHCSGSDFALLLAHTTQWMLSKEPRPRLLPSVSVSTLSGVLSRPPAIRVDRLYCPCLRHLDAWLDGSQPTHCAFSHTRRWAAEQDAIPSIARVPAYLPTSARDQYWH